MPEYTEEEGIEEEPLDRRDAVNAPARILLLLLYGGLLGAWGADGAAPLDDHARVIAQRLSQKTGVSVDQLIAAHKSGKGWEAIAQEHNIKLGPMVSEAGKL